MNRCRKPASSYRERLAALGALTRIAGDEVLELVLNGVIANRDELLGYGFLEEILHYKRRWFVVYEYADNVLSRLLAQRKPIKDLTDRDAISSELNKIRPHKQL